MRMRAAATAIIVTLVLGSIPAGTVTRAQTAGPRDAPVSPAPKAASTGSSPGAGAPGEAAAPEETPAAPAQAGGVRIEVEADRKTVTVGDPITITIRLFHPPEVRITSFEPERFLGDLALLERKTGETKTLQDGRVQESRVLRVARYKIGASRVPSIEASFVDAAGKEGKVATPPVPFAVGSILQEGDTRTADIKNPAVMTVRRLWPFILAAAAAIVLAAVWMWRRRSRRALPRAEAPAAAPRPAHEVAYAEMERLLSSGLLESGQVKRFYIELAEILRRYVEARFGVETFERTTAEIMEALRLARLPMKGMALTAEFFGACDMVKFAKHVPAPEETRATVEVAYRLVDETRAREPVPGEGLPVAAGAAAGSGR